MKPFVFIEFQKWQSYLWHKLTQIIFKHVHFGDIGFIQL